ncbi:MAG: hypothetical protein Hens3KO_25080 [Henriciella sp.]
MGVKVFVFGAISGASIGYYAAHLTMGYLIYRLIANGVIGGSGVFVGAQNWIKAEPLPLSVHVYKTMMNNFFIFLLSAIPAISICAYFQVYHFAALQWLVPALLIYAINTIWIGLLFGIISARYRDIMHFSTTAMQVLYFLSPVLWIPPEEGIRALAAKLNPITHYLAILRQPMIDGTVPYYSWGVVMSCTGIGLVFTFALFAFARRRLVFWL